MTAEEFMAGGGTSADDFMKAAPPPPAPAAPISSTIAAPTPAETAATPGALPNYAADPVPAQQLPPAPDEDKTMLAQSGLSSARTLGQNPIPNGVQGAALATAASIPGLRDVVAKIAKDPFYRDPNIPWEQKKARYTAELEAVKRGDPAEYQQGARDLKSDLIQVGSGLVAGPVAKGSRAVSTALGALTGGAAAAVSAPDDKLRAGLKGAAVGAGGSFLGATAAGAPERVTKRVITELGDGAKPSQRRGLSEVDGNLREVLQRNPQLVKAADKPLELRDHARELLKAQSAEGQQIFGQADQERGGGVRLGDVLDNMDKGIAKVSKRGARQDEARALERHRADFVKAYGEDPEVRIPSATLREEGTDLQAKGYGKGQTIAESAAIKAAKQASMAVLDPVTRHVTGQGYEAARAVARQEPDSTAGRYFKHLDDTSVLARIESAADTRAKNLTGEGNRMKNIARGNAPLTTKVQRAISENGGAAVDRGLARAVNAAGTAADKTGAVLSHIFGSPSGPPAEAGPTKLAPLKLQPRSTPPPPASPAPAVPSPVSPFDELTAPGMVTPTSEEATVVARRKAGG